VAAKLRDHARLSAGDMGVRGRGYVQQMPLFCKRICFVLHQSTDFDFYDKSTDYSRDLCLFLAIVLFVPLAHFAIRSVAEPGWKGRADPIALLIYTNFTFLNVKYVYLHYCAANFYLTFLFGVLDFLHFLFKLVFI
jgi:hypothetical protein